ncbi:MAG: hypothetical protein GKS00_01185 [Alphaproteobacteria bacterium]|nr:hypothetical protein [Alphaproteobacteria bacterium]
MSSRSWPKVDRRPWPGRNITSSPSGQSLSVIERTNWEDPATGSAAAALGAFLVSLESNADGAARIHIEQGVEMGRPSEIIVNAGKSGGQIERVTIAGRCVPVMQGVIAL